MKTSIIKIRNEMDLEDHKKFKNHSQGDDDSKSVVF